VAELKNHQLSHEAETRIVTGTKSETEIQFRGSSRSADQQSGGIDKGIIKVSFFEDQIILFWLYTQMLLKKYISTVPSYSEIDENPRPKGSEIERGGEGAGTKKER
jgi:hypothetical protein